MSVFKLKLARVIWRARLRSAARRDFPPPFFVFPAMETDDSPPSDDPSPPKQKTGHRSEKSPRNVHKQRPLGLPGAAGTTTDSFSDISVAPPHAHTHNDQEKAFSGEPPKFISLSLPGKLQRNETPLFPNEMHAPAERPAAPSKAQIPMRGRSPAKPRTNRLPGCEDVDTCPTSLDLQIHLSAMSEVALLGRRQVLLDELHRVSTELGGRAAKHVIAAKEDCATRERTSCVHRQKGSVSPVPAHPSPQHTLKVSSIGAQQPLVESLRALAAVVASSSISRSRSSGTSAGRRYPLNTRTGEQFGTFQLQTQQQLQQNFRNESLLCAPKSPRDHVGHPTTEAIMIADRSGGLVISPTGKGWTQIPPEDPLFVQFPNKNILSASYDLPEQHKNGLSAPTSSSAPFGSMSFGVAASNNANPTAYDLIKDQFVPELSNTKRTDGQMFQRAKAAASGVVATSPRREPLPHAPHPFVSSLKSDFMYPSHHDNLLQELRSLREKRLQSS